MMTVPFYPFVVRALSEEDGGGYLVQVLDLVGCMADGDTPEEAAKNVRLAIVEWIAEAKRLGRDVPEPNSCVKRTRQARSEMSELVKRQQTLIEEQDALIRSQQETISALREELRVAIEDDGAVDLGWASTVPAGAAAPRDLPH